MCLYENYSWFLIERQHLYRNKQTSVIIILPKLDDSATTHKLLQSSYKSCQDLLPTLIGMNLALVKKIVQLNNVCLKQWTMDTELNRHL